MSFHGADRATEHLGDLRHGQVVEVAQHHHGTLPPRQPTQRLPHRVRLYRTGRDRRHAARIPGLGPPEGVRPGQIGALITGKATVRDVTATVVDLSVRGYLKVKDIGRDWRLT